MRWQYLHQDTARTGDEAGHHQRARSRGTKGVGADERGVGPAGVGNRGGVYPE